MSKFTILTVTELWKANKNRTWELQVEDVWINVSLVDMFNIIKSNSLAKFIKELKKEGPFDTDTFRMQMEMKEQAILDYLAELKFYKNSPNKVPSELIIEVDSSDLRVEDGNHRLVAAKLARLKELKVELF